LKHAETKLNTFFISLQLRLKLFELPFIISNKVSFKPYQTCTFELFDPFSTSNDRLNFSFVKDIHAVGKKNRSKGSEMAIYQ
jgi:hypothetical protein